MTSSNLKQQTIGVIGAGAWGTSLSCLLVEKNLILKLWALEKETVQNINELRENKVFLSEYGAFPPAPTIPRSLPSFLPPYLPALEWRRIESHSAVCRG